MIENLVVNFDKSNELYNKLYIKLNLLPLSGSKLRLAHNSFTENYRMEINIFFKEVNLNNYKKSLVKVICSDIDIIKCTYYWSYKNFVYHSKGTKDVLYPLFKYDKFFGYISENNIIFL